MAQRRRRWLLLAAAAALVARWTSNGFLASSWPRRRIAAPRADRIFEQLHRNEPSFAARGTRVATGRTVSAAGASSGEAQFEERLAGALWGLFVGDALAMPVHWYYGGPQQIQRDFGGEIKGYQRSRWPFPESIMQVSSTGGAGRGSAEGDVIGDVILHGKKHYWTRDGQYHYHHTLLPGENTLEASLVRVFMRSVAATGQLMGSADAFRDAYVTFMTTPGSHNDTYASTSHRMFFERYQQGTAAEHCPDNDGHNVDTMDALVIPAVAATAALAAGQPRSAAVALAGEVLAVTRRSSELLPYVEDLTRLLEAVLHGARLPEAVARGAAVGGVEFGGAEDPMVACYVGSCYPAMLHFAYKYGSEPRRALLSSANAGGENVHRGAVLGALVGAAFGAKSLPEDLVQGLVHWRELQEEIQAFVDVVTRLREEALKH